MTATAAAVYRDPGEAPAAVLSVLVHVAFLAFLLFGVTWQTKSPDAVVVELWDRTPAVEPQPVQTPPAVEPKPEPPREVKPETRPEPKAEPKAQKPDIAVEREKKLPAKKEEPKIKLDRQQANKEQLAREIEAVQREREKRDVLSKFQPLPAGPKADPSYVNRIRAKIRSNIVLPPGIQGNPDTIFDVVQFPTGEVRDLRLRKSSGYPALDQAVERAIRKSSPLPLPDSPGQFVPNLELRFWPQE